MEGAIVLAVVYRCLNLLSGYSTTDNGPSTCSAFLYAALWRSLQMQGDASGSCLEARYPVINSPQDFSAKFDVCNPCIPIPVAAVVPASTGRTTPVTQRARSLARNRTADPTSHPFPSVFSRLLAARVSRSVWVIPAPLLYIIGVYTIPNRSASSIARNNNTKERESYQGKHN